MVDVWQDTGSNTNFASKMPDISNDADIQKVIQAYHYGDPVNATAGSFSGSWTDSSLGILGKLIYLNDTLTSLDSAKIGKSLLTAKGGLISATAASTPAMLSVGTNGHVLKANSSTSTGLEWYNLDTTHLNLNPSSQTLTGDLTMSKASPRVAINATSGHSYVTSSGASGSEAGFLLSTSSTLRWGIQKIASGDNLSIIRYNDGGSAVGTPLAIDRSTGLTTLSSLTVSGATTGTTLSMSSTGSFGGKLTTVASGTGSAGLNIPTGTAPSSPVSGDMWTTTDGVYVRIDSTTYPLAIVADGPGGLSADNVTSGILAGQYGGTGVNNSGKTITLGGNLTTSGAYGLTLTLTGATSVTLPTSGTLVNSAVTTLSSLVSVGTVTTGTWNASVVAGQYGGTGVANTGKTITLGGNLVTSGAYSLTMTLTGATSVTMPTTGTVATTSDITTAINNLINSAPGALDTLDELAAALGDDPNFATTVTNSIALKAPIASPTFTGLVTTAASTVGSAGFRLPLGTDPTTPTHGDIWTTTTDVRAYINGSTVVLAQVSGGSPVNSASDINAGVLSPTYGGTGVNNGVKTITLSGNTTLGSSTHTLAFATSGNTSVTLPTSGTLVNSAVTTLSNLVSIGTITTGTWNGSVIAGQYGGTGVANTGKTITVSGNTTIGSSTNTVAFATSGNTSVTLPTSGTLATLGSPTFTGTVTAPTFTASTSLNLAAVADTATTATHYYVETATDGLVRPKTLANVKTEIVTTAAVNAAAATTVGTITSGTWQGTAINATYIDSAIARLASPTFTGTPLSTTAAVDTNTTQIATTAYVVGQGYLKSSTASSTYAPLASPTFTGTVVLPTTTSIGNVSSTEIGYLDGVTSSIQTQLNGKAASSHAHAQSDITNLVTDLAAKAPLASPTFTGTVTVPTLNLNGATSGHVEITAPAVAGTQSIEFPTDVVQKSELEWTSYTPTWTTGTVGNGTLVGRYLQAGSLCHFSVRLTYGSTTSSSSVGWTFSLPVTSAGDAAASAFILDDGVTYYTGVAHIAAGATNFHIVTHASATAIGYNAPFAWATNDFLVVSGTYEI